MGMTGSPVSIQTLSRSEPSTPFWFGGVFAPSSATSRLLSFPIATFPFQFHLTRRSPDSG